MPMSNSEVTIDTVDGSGFGQDCAVENGGSGCYTPMEATVDVGGKVIMVNSDPTGAAHSFTSGTVAGFSPSPDGIFDSGLLNQDESFEWSPDTVAEVPYYCFLHTWMQGTIIVQEAAAAPEEAAAAPEEAAAAPEEAAAAPEEAATSTNSPSMDVKLIISAVPGSGSRRM